MSANLTPSAAVRRTTGLKRAKPEANLQTACLRWFALQYPRLRDLLRAGAEGGSRNAREAANLKRTGVSAGWPDLHLADGRPGLWVELKVPGGRLSELQRTKLALLQSQGYTTAVCYSIEEFQDTINTYLKP
ncbi:VRR-NUC domain-containing protein [Hymenobacter tenuis]